MLHIKTISIPASDLIPGLGFKLPKQRYFRTCSNIHFFTSEEIERLKPTGNMLIHFDGCKQLVINKTDMVQIQIQEFDQAAFEASQKLKQKLFPFDLPF